MTNQVTGVGIIGVSADRGWAGAAHIPALASLDAFELRAISAHTPTGADAAGRKYGVSHAFSNSEALISDADVQLVVVAVKAPNHFELVTAALQAGKDVYCEWPLGSSLGEAQSMAVLARGQGVRTVIGLQGRNVPEIEHARMLVANGYLGRVLSTSLTGMQSRGATVPRSNVYMMNEASGASMLTVSVGHCLDTLAYVLGEFDTVSALTAVRQPEMVIQGSAEVAAKNTADEVALFGSLQSGAVASIHIHEGSAGGTGFLWEIHGSEGSLQLTADWAFPGIYPVTLSGSRGVGVELRELAVPVELRQDPGSLGDLVGTPAYNVGRTYASYAADLADNTHNTAGFDEALTRHKLLSLIAASAASGTRQSFLTSSVPA